MASEKFIVKRTDGFYLRASYNIGAGNNPVIMGQITWRQRREDASRYPTQLFAEQIAGQLDNPPRGVQIIVEAV